MSNKRRGTPRSAARTSAASAPAGAPRSRRLLLALGVVLLAGLGLWGWGFRARAPVRLAPTPPSPPANLPIAAPAVPPDYSRLQGRWLRPDGGYVLEIRSVDASGRMDAAYSNPRPIHVAKAEATQDRGVQKVFVELRDVNYPGSTYTLVYDPTRDELAGNYFQALLRESFEVVFVRQR